MTERRYRFLGPLLIIPGSLGVLGAAIDNSANNSALEKTSTQATVDYVHAEAALNDAGAEIALINKEIARMRASGMTDTEIANTGVYARRTVLQTEQFRALDKQTDAMGDATNANNKFHRDMRRTLGLGAAGLIMQAAGTILGLREMILASNKPRFRELPPRRRRRRRS